MNIPPVGSPRGTQVMQNGHISHAAQVPQMQNPMLKTSNPEVPLPSGKMSSIPKSAKSTSSSNAGPSPKLFRHPMDKGKIDSLVQSAEREKSPDSAKVKMCFSFICIDLIGLNSGTKGVITQLS